MNEDIHIENLPENTFHVWGLPEVLYGVLAMIVISALMMLTIYFFKIKSNAILIIYEALYILPPIVVLLLKKAPLKALGIKRFAFAELMVGASFLFIAYIVIILHNLTLMAFNIAPQGETIAGLFGQDINIWVVGAAVVIIAPIAEEVFFRGFVYAGLVDRFGWKKAVLFSALLFGAAHTQLVAFIPTFLMGLVLAYTYHRSKSILPSMLLHFAVNGLGFTMIYMLMTFGDTLSL